MDLTEKIKIGKLVFGIIGLGYVGLPLAVLIARSNLSVIGFDTDNKKIKLLTEGKSYIRHLGNEVIQEILSYDFKPTSDFAALKDCDVIFICVPTPLSKNREPEMKYIIDTARTIAKYIRKDQVIILRNTTYPGTTDEVLVPILENSGLTAGKDFYVSFSPEREDPSNKEFNTYNTPVIVGGYT